jgi:hypothetical protein
MFEKKMEFKQAILLCYRKQKNINNATKNF